MRKPIEKGDVFGKLTVIRNTYERDNHGRTIYECICECGNRKNVIGNSLKSGSTKSCGCLHLEKAKNPIFMNNARNMHKFKKENQLTINEGEIFGKLTVIKKLDEKHKAGHTLFECICECGNIHKVVYTWLKQGKVKSCGCLAREHSKKLHKYKKSYIDEITNLDPIELNNTLYGNFLHKKEDEK